MNKSWCKEVLEQAMMLLTELENAFARLRSCLEVRISLPAGYGYGFAKKEKEKEKKAWLQQLLLDGKKMVTYSL